MRRRAAALTVLVFLAAGSLRADVAPFPSWRLAANGTIMRAVQAGSAVYVAGTFTKIGRAIPSFGATLDPATLSFVPRTGCARTGTAPVHGRYAYAPAALSDGAGPFAVPAGTAVVRVGSDCRFDRRFRVVLPPGVLVWPGPNVAEVGNRVYFPVLAANTGFLVEVDGVTGAVRRYWPGAGVAGVLPDGRLVTGASSNGNTSTDIGVFDPDTGQFTVAHTAPGTWTIEHVGAVVLLARFLGAEYDLLALDGTTLTPLPQWPVVRAYQPVYGSGDNRLFIWAPTLSVGGVATAHLMAFDATTGARLDAFVSPWWLDDAYSRVAHLAVANGRVVVLGDFAAVSPRDTAAVFDATTGALDPWSLPYALPNPVANDSLLYFPTIDARDRVSRTAVAAVDAVTGATLPWTATVPLTLSPFGRYALAADTPAGHLYVGWTGTVRRFDLATGQIDSTWGLDTGNPTAGWNQISDIALAGGTVYVSGSFARVRDDPASAWQSREGGAAVTTAGALTAWAPQVRGNCFVAARPVGDNFPCVSQLLPVAGRLVMQGGIERLLAPDEPVRSAMAVTPDTGAVDGFVPLAPAGVVAAIATDGDALFATARLPALSLARIDQTSGARVVGPLAVNAFGAAPALALHAGRIYADVERDPVTAAPTGNPMEWRLPVAATSGVLDIVDSRMSHHADAAPLAPQPPTNLTAAYDAAVVRLQWSPGVGDLVPLVSPPPPGGTAATSHIVLASLTPGGAPVAQFDTGSADTTFSVTAPTGTFYVRVQARNAFGTSAPSAELRVDVQPQVPNPPPATTVVVSAGTVRIEWQAPPLGWPATGYLLEAGTAPGLSNIGTLPVAATSFEAAVPPGRYYVRVRAVNASGASGPGDEVVIDVP